MKYYFLLIIFLVNQAFSQKVKCDISVDLDVFGEGMNFSQAPDTILTRNTSVQLIKIYLLNCCGNLNFEAYHDNENVKNDDTILVLKGSYFGTCQIEHDIGESVDTFGQITKNVTMEYYRPLRNGQWFYWDIKKHLIKKELYIKGNLIKSHRFIRWYFTNKRKLDI